VFAFGRHGAILTIELGRAAGAVAAAVALATVVGPVTGALALTRDVLRIVRDEQCVVHVDGDLGLYPARGFDEFLCLEYVERVLQDEMVTSSASRGRKAAWDVQLCSRP
jgi:hypothetical protein